MASIDTTESGRSGARDVPVWDPLVRLVHWGVAIGVLVNSFDDADAALHQWVGYAVAGLVGVRLLWGMVGPRPARFSAFPPNPFAALRHLAAGWRGEKMPVHLSHNPLGALMVYNIWSTLAVLGATGYMMTTMTFFGVEWVEEAHEMAHAWLVASVALHVAGVVIDGARTHVPLVRAMVTGRKRIPEGTQLE